MKKRKQKEIFKTRHSEIFFNRADTEEADKINCDNCFEQLVFHMQDKDHEFSMGLSTVLECLAFAEDEGEVPKLPPEWWLAVKRRYRSLNNYM